MAGGSSDLSLGSDADFYPDLIRLGGLASAMADIARKNGLDVGDVAAQTRVDGLVAVVLPAGKGHVGVALAMGLRYSSVSISVGGRLWASGGTSDLLEAVKVASVWRAGSTLEQLRAQFPFMEYGSLAKAFEGGDPVAVRWDHILAESDFEPIRPLLMAAYANRRLAALFPSVSHLTVVRLEMDHSDRSAGEILIEELADGTYRVEATWRDGSQEAVTVDAAVEAAVSYLSLEPSALEASE